MGKITPSGPAGGSDAERLETRPRPNRPSFLRQLGNFFVLTLRQGHEDSILLTASALAFVTILSLVPLLASLSFIGARVFSQYPEKSLEVFVQVFPYAEKTVTDKLREFLDQAEGMHGIGLASLFAIALLAFATVEETFNKIWNVSRRRPFRRRLLSFGLLLFWGPLLVGATFSSVILLRQSPGLHRLVQESFLLHLAPFAGTVVGLTILYWLVPYTKVRLRNALAGGLLGGILLETVRQGFGYYVELFHGVSTVYGSSAFAMLFMISIELTWAIVLLGSEAAYTAQHFALLTRGLHTHPPVQASWVGLAAVVLIAEHSARLPGGPPLRPPLLPASDVEPAISSAQLAERLSLPVRDLERTLHPLIAQGVLHEVGDRTYLLAHDPATLDVERVFDAYAHRARRGVEHVGGDLRVRLEVLIESLEQSRRERLGRLTVEDLLAGLPAAGIPAPAAPAENTELVASMRVE